MSEEKLLTKVSSVLIGSLLQDTPPPLPAKVGISVENVGAIRMKTAERKDRRNLGPSR
jgi:hypothetical protein